MNRGDIIDKARAYVEKLYAENVSGYYCYHSLEHTQRVTNAAEEIANASGLSDKEVEILILAALFHDAGFAITYLANEPEGAKIAESFLKEQNYPQEGIRAIKKLILATELTHKPKNLLEEIIRDADLIHLGREDFFTINDLLREEWRLVIDREMTDKAWIELTLGFQNFHAFNTEYAAEKYGPIKEANIEKLRLLADKIQ